MNKEIIEKLMDKYAQSVLSEAERKQLDKIIEKSPEIKKELEVRKDIVKSLQLLGNKDLQVLMDKIHKEEIDTPRKKSVIFKLILLAACLLIPVAILFLFKNGSNEKLSPAQHYTSNYEAYIPSISSRGEDEKSDEFLFSQAYINKDYESALSSIRPLIEEMDIELTLMAGISAIETNDFTLASSLFEKIIEAEDYYFVDHARWYLALAYLKNSDVPNARIHLEALVLNSEADHYSEAKDLLSKI